jgi:hypothetical protein
MPILSNRVRADYFRYGAGGLLFATHVVVIVVLLFFSTTRTQELTERLAIVFIAIPVTLVYVVAFIKFVIQHADANLDQSSNTDTYNILSASTMGIVIFVFCVALIVVAVTYTWWNFSDPEQFKLILGVIETGFGGLVGTIFEMLFGVTIKGPDVLTNASKGAEVFTNAPPVRE